MENLSDKITQQETTALQELVQWCGSQAALATLLNVSQQVVCNWVQRGRISATKAAEIEVATNGQFKKQYLRPDVREWRI